MLHFVKCCYCTIPRVIVPQDPACTIHTPLLSEAIACKKHVGGNASILSTYFAMCAGVYTEEKWVTIHRSDKTNMNFLSFCFLYGSQQLMTKTKGLHQIHVNLNMVERTRVIYAVPAVWREYLKDHMTFFFFFLKSGWIF